MSRQAELRILVCGSDQWFDDETVREAISLLPKRAVIVQRGVGAADWIAELAARDRRLRVEAPPLDLELALNAELRASKALDRLRPAVVLAFLFRGDESCDALLRQARERGVRVRVFRPGWRKGDPVEE